MPAEWHVLVGNHEHGVAICVWHADGERLGTEASEINGIEVSHTEHLPTLERGGVVIVPQLGGGLQVALAGVQPEFHHLGFAGLRKRLGAVDAGDDDGVLEGVGHTGGCAGEDKGVGGRPWSGTFAVRAVVFGALATVVQTAVALAGGGESAERAAVVDVVTDPREVVVVLDGGVVRVEQDGLEPLLRAVLADPV